MVDRNEFVELAEEKYGSKFTQLGDDAEERLFEKFEDKYETFGDESLALTAAVGSFNFEENMDGEAGQLDVIGLGTNGPRPFGDSDALFCYGLAVPDEGKVGRIVIIVNEDDVKTSLYDIADLFKRYNVVQAEINYREAGKVNGIHEGSAAYIGEIGVENEPFSDDVDEGEDVISLEDRKEMVEEHVPVAKIANVSEHYSLMDNGYTANFGLDFKRIPNAVVLEARISSNGARYVFQDDSFLEPEELSPDVRGDDNDIGLAGWAEPHVAEFGQESIVDVFGTITPSDDGQTTIRIYGAAASQEGSVVEVEAPEEDDSSDGSSSQSSGSDSSGTSGEPVEERTI